jgi:threonine aldolase
MGCDAAGVETNIVACHPPGGVAFCTKMVAALRARGVLVSQLAPTNIRLVTHRHIGEAEVDAALAAVREAITELPAG